MSSQAPPDAVAPELHAHHFRARWVAARSERGCAKQNGGLSLEATRKLHQQRHCSAECPLGSAPSRAVSTSSCPANIAWAQ
jgi:hypothetical protein